MVFPGNPPLVALQDISLTIKDKEFLVIVGPSGCGKSTLLRLVAGLLQPAGGKIVVHGKSPARAQRDVEFGFVFQEAVLFPWLTALQNVILPVEILGQRSPLPVQEAEAAARQLLADVRLHGFEAHYPEQLSGGMRQRVSLARALVYRPSTLLMDEPFGALDEITRDSLNLLLLEVWEKNRATVIFVTHSISEALFLADRVVVLSPRPGRITTIVDVPLSRPRSFNMRFLPEFTKLTAELRHLLQSPENVHEN